MPLPLIPIVLALVELLRPGLFMQAGIGAFVWAVMVCALGRAAWLAARALLRDEASPGDVAPAAVDRIVLHSATGLLLFFLLAAGVCTLTGFLGWTRLPWVLLLAGVVAFAIESACGSESPSAPARAANSSRVSSWFGIFIALFACAGVGMIALNSVLQTVQEADAMWYHFPLVAEWVQSAAIRPAEVVPELARAYPGLRAGVQVFLSLAVGHEHLATLGALELVLLGAAFYSLSRSLKLASVLGAAGTAVVVLTPMVTRAAMSEGTDVFMSAACVFYVLFAQRLLDKGRTADAFLAGLSLGMVAAAKYSGLPYALALIGLTGFEALWRGWGRRGRAVWLRCGGALIGAAALVAGPWYLRNLIVYGNPLWPARIAPAGVLLFDGPVSSEWLAERSLGFAVGPLIEHSEHFQHAFGWSVLLACAAPVLLLVLALGARARGHSLPPDRRWLLLALAPAALFVLFLQQPFNKPNVRYVYNMRYLLPWFALSVAAGTAGLSLLFGRRLAWIPALLLAGLATLELRHWSMKWPLALLLAGILTPLVLWLWPRLVPWAKRMCTQRGWVVRSLLPLAVVSVAWPIERFRREVQYDPEHGYHDSPSSRGWGAAVRYVHRELAGERIAFGGYGLFFPLYGDEYENRVFALPAGASAEQALDFCRKRAIDVLVAFVPSHRPEGQGNYVHGESLGPALLAAEPALEVLHGAQGAYVLRLPNSRVSR